MYEIKVITHFAAAHQLKMVAEKCENLHGHNWKIEVYVAGDELNDAGVLMDFGEIKKTVSALETDYQQLVDFMVTIQTDFDKLKKELEELRLEASKAELIKYVPGENKFEIRNMDRLTEEQQKGMGFMRKFLEDFGNTGVQEVLNKMVFEKLKYISVFPGGVNKLEDKDGNILPDCHLLPEGSTALDFAYKIHKDLGDNFIKAITVRDKMARGKEYKLKDGDIMEIVTKK